MSEQPSVVRREAQPYVAIATAVTMEGFDVVDALTDEVVEWLEANGVAASGSPLVRVVTSDMSAELDIEVGLTVENPPVGDGHFLVGSVPAGSYVRLLYSPVTEHDHYEANVELQAWAANEGLEWAIDRSGGGDVWLGRFQFDRSSDGHPVFEQIYQIVD